MRSVPTNIRQQPITRIERIARKFVIDENGCWVWQNAKDIKGYGRVGVGYRVYLSHRVMYELIVGETRGGGEVLDHLCRVSSCVNPAHLEEVTQYENSLRGLPGVAMIYANASHCRNGHEFTPESSYRLRPNVTSRKCRICLNARRRLRYKELVGREVKKYNYNKN